MNILDGIEGRERVLTLWHLPKRVEVWKQMVGVAHKRGGHKLARPVISSCILFIKTSSYGYQGTVHISLNVVKTIKG